MSKAIDPMTGQPYKTTPKGDPTPVVKLQTANIAENQKAVLSNPDTKMNTVGTWILQQQ